MRSVARPTLPAAIAHPHQRTSLPRLPSPWPIPRSGVRSSTPTWGISPTAPGHRPLKASHRLPPPLTTQTPPVPRGELRMATDTLSKDLRRATPGRGGKNAGEAPADARPLHLINLTGNTWGAEGAEVLIAPPAASGEKRAAREGDRASAQQGKNHMAHRL
jgi:hypothetical protein